MHVSRTEFEELVEEALAKLPPEFAGLLENIAVVVEEEPSDDDLEVLGEDREEHDELLGLYRGPILRVAGSRREAIREIRETVIHELGHYFGLHDDDMVF